LRAPRASDDRGTAFVDDRFHIHSRSSSVCGSGRVASSISFPR
jgi:hypothetical protein